MPRILANLRREEGGGKSLSYRFQRGHGPVETLMSDFKIPELRENKLVVLSHLLCGPFLQQP